MQYLELICRSLQYRECQEEYRTTVILCANPSHELCATLAPGVIKVSINKIAEKLTHSEIKYRL